MRASTIMDSDGSGEFFKVHLEPTDWYDPMFVILERASLSREKTQGGACTEKDEPEEDVWKNSGMVPVGNFAS